MVVHRIKFRALVLIAALMVGPDFAAEAAPNPASSRATIKQIVVAEAMISRVPPSLALAVAKVESDFNAKALSPKGARGVMQIMPATARGEFGVHRDELWDARLNIQLGIDFLEQLIDRYQGRWDLALSYYNGGSAVGQPGNARVLPQTRKYVDAVLRWERRYAAQALVWRSANGRGATRARTRTHAVGSFGANGKSARAHRTSSYRANADRIVGRHGRRAPKPAPGFTWSKDASLDDFTPDFVERMNRSRHLLHRFPARVSDG